MEKNNKKEEDNKKPLNIVLIGEDCSEKEELITKFLLKNTDEFQENEMKKEEDKEEDKSILQNIEYSVEMHGEKIKMKLWDNPPREEFLSPSIKIAQGILLFYSIKNKKSFEKIQEDLKKIIELGRFDIPIVVIGNHSDTKDREVSYEEAKTFADNYGLRLYEISIGSNITIKQILQDIGEQLLFQECINTANNSLNFDNDINLNEDVNFDLDDNLNIGELIESKNKENKNENNNNEINNSLNENELKHNLSESNLFNSDINSSVKKAKSNKQISNFSLFTSNSSANFKNNKNKKIISLKNNKANQLNKSGSVILNNNNNKSSLINYSSFNIFKKNKNNSKKNNNSILLPSNSNKNIINSSLNNSASSKNIHSYLKKTAITKNREKETKENKIKLEKEFQSIGAQKEREGLELNKKKKLEDKQIYIKKIKEDKIIQKEKEKNKKEEQIKQVKNKYEKLKKEKEETVKEKKIEKEKEKMNKIMNKQNEKKKINKMKEELNKKKEKELENMKIKKEKEKEREKEREKEKEKLKEEKEKEIEKNKEKLKEEKILKEKEQEEKMKQLLIKKKNNKEKIFSPKKPIKEKIDKGNIKNLDNNNITKNTNTPTAKVKKEKINKNDKEKEKENELINDEIKKENIEKKEENKKENENEKEKEKEIDNKNAIKEEIKNKYINNPNIYRCLKCHLIPQILINEYNQEIEVFCENSFHHNITNYKDFKLNNFSHSFNDNIFCNYCNKTLNQLSSNNMIYYCHLCETYYCSNDELTHKNQKHQNNLKIKDYYKSIYDNNNQINLEGLTRTRSVGKKTNNSRNSISATGRRLSFRSNLPRDKIDNNKKIETKELIPQEDKENKNINLNIKKFPIYLMDTYCSKHDEILNSYCHNCHKNICNICQNKEHENHFIENFNEIFLNEEEVNKKKIELNIVKDNLSKINDYFTALIEAIKCRFEKLYKLKQKEIEIKEKIINDYETIKYNYNCIMNIKNLNINNKQSFINSTNNVDWLNRLNLIFEYLNSSLISNEYDIFKTINNNNGNSKFQMMNFKNEKIKNIINLYNNDFAISNNNGELKIYSEKCKEKLKVKLFNEGEGINYTLKLNNGTIACCGYEKIIFVHLDLYNQSYFIEKILEEKYNNFNSLIEFNNNCLVSSGSSKKISLWINSKNKIKKNNIDLFEGIEEIDMLYKIIPFSFVACSYKNKTIIKYKIYQNNEIKLESKLNDISVVKGYNSIINLPFNKNILLICYQDNIKEFGVIIVNCNNFEIISKIKNKNPFYYINIFEKDNIITIDKSGLIQKWKYVELDKKIYECDKVNHPLNIYNDNQSLCKKLKSFISINNNNYLFQYTNGIVCITN